jgi:hypothetical protein
VLSRGFDQLEEIATQKVQSAWIFIFIRRDNGMSVVGHTRGIRTINRRFGVMVKQVEKFFIGDVCFLAGSEGIKGVCCWSQAIHPG